MVANLAASKISAVGSIYGQFGKRTLESLIKVGAMRNFGKRKQA